jgi:signal transduction histidine kinase
MSQEISVNASTLISAALRQTNLAGYSEILGIMAKALNAYGCVLWQVAPGSEAHETQLGGYLFVLADWFDDNREYGFHEVPLHNSVTGRAALSGETVNVYDIQNDRRGYVGDSFLFQGVIRAMCSVPFRFQDEGSGVLNFYRTTPQPFGNSDLRQAEQFASLIPDLYRTIRNEISLRLISDINEKLQNADLLPDSDYFSKGQTGRVFQKICASVSDAFQCVETSIFIENRLEKPGRYELAATTFPDSLLKSIYSASADDGLTGWVIAHAQPVRIFDLAHWERDVEAARKKYPGIVWHDALDLKSVVRKLLDISPDERLPLLSFMAAPLVIGKKVLGVIRCSLPRRGLYFSDRDLHLLGLAAAQITRFWNNWLGRREAFEENQFLQSLVASVGELNGFVNKEFAGRAPGKERIFAEALRVIGSIISGAEIIDIRLLDEESRELYFAEMYGDFWNAGDRQSVLERLRRRFPVGDSPEDSAGARVFMTGETYITSDAREAARQGDTFAETKEMIVAPISIEGKVFGVLDVRSTSQGAFTPSAMSAVQLLGQQIGLYCYLADAIHEMQALRNEQAQTFEDLTHQLKSPINLAYMRIQAVLRAGVPDDNLLAKLLAIRGLCAKARRVMMSARLLADLPQDRPIRPNLLLLTHDGAVRAVIEAAADNQMLIDPSIAIKFRVDRESFKVLDSCDVRVDPDLLNQALSNILDNAGKYSYSNTTVRISAGLTASKRFFISVQNQGLPIRPHEIRHIFERGWRGESATTTTGEGSGIGLWIVSHIMRAHGGELLVTPTSERGLTDIRLVLPSSNSGPEQL